MCVSSSAVFTNGVVIAFVFLSSVASYAPQQKSTIADSPGTPDSENLTRGLFGTHWSSFCVFEMLYVTTFGNSVFSQAPFPLERTLLNRAGVMDANLAAQNIWCLCFPWKVFTSGHKSDSKTYALLSVAGWNAWLSYKLTRANGISGLSRVLSLP